MKPPGLWCPRCGSSSRIDPRAADQAVCQNRDCGLVWLVTDRQLYRPTSALAAKPEATVALLDELAAAGLITLEIERRNWEASELHLEVYARREMLDQEAPPTVSAKARQIWDMLRTGQLRMMT